MATIVRFTQESYDDDTYHCEQDARSGEYVLFSDYRHDLANVQQELIAAQEEIGRLREALEPFAEFAKITANSNNPAYLSYTYLQKDSGDRFYQITGNDFKKAKEALND